MVSLEKRQPRIQKLTIPYDPVVMAIISFHCESTLHHGFMTYNLGRHHFTLDCPRFKDLTPRDPWTFSAFPASWDWLLRQAEQSTTFGIIPPEIISKIETYLSECEKFYDDSDII